MKMDKANYHSTHSRDLKHQKQTCCSEVLAQNAEGQHWQCRFLEHEQMVVGFVQPKVGCLVTMAWSTGDFER